MIQSVVRFLKSIDFFKSITLLIALLIPLGLFNLLGVPSLAISVAMGVFLCFPSDIPGSMRHMALGIFVSSIIAMVTMLAIHLAYFSLWVLMPVLAVLVFFYSMLSVYGFRASLVSFSGLLAIILAFARPTSGQALLAHASFVFVGGMWYLGVTMVAHALVFRRHNQLILAECMQLTAQYLRVRAQLVEKPQQTDQLQKELFTLQTEINEKHEKLREIFVSERNHSGNSYSANKYILIFIELVDILELTISNPANYHKLGTYFKGEEDVLKPFIRIIKTMAERLENQAEVVARDRKEIVKVDTAPLFQEAQAKLDNYLQTHQLSQLHEEGIILGNLLDYEQKQQQKIESIERVLQNLTDQEQIMRRSQDVEKFITQQDYDVSILLQNLNTKSTIFRHAVRLTVTVMLGYLLSSLIMIQIPYWVMLTIVVIMRPSYGLTKSRSIQRVYGTLIGGVIALIIVLLTQHPVVYGSLAAVSLVFAISLVQKNYAGSAVFITLTVVFLYTFIKPDAFNVIQYRVLDTAVGAGFSFLASLFLWPSWEFMNIQKVLADSIGANRKYLQEISNYYQQKGEVPTVYKLARKEAFIAVGEMSAAFQRMNQEPKSKRQNFAKTYELSVLNHTFLTAAAALGTYIQNHVTSEKSTYFQAYIDSAEENLKAAQALLNGESPSKTLKSVQLEGAKSYLEEQYQQLVEVNRNMSTAEFTSPQKEKQIQLQEASLIIGQLKWINSLSESIKNAVLALQ